MTPDILIAGGGLAGGAAALALAQAGRAVTVIEREAAPVDKVCGAFLSHEAQDYLQDLGLDLPALGGHCITRLRLIRGPRQVEAKLPFQGLGLSRLALDEALAGLAARAGATIWRGHAVAKISHANGWRVAAGALGVFTPRTLCLATGKHDARGVPRGTPAGAPRGTAPGAFIGFKTDFALSAAQQAALAQHVELLFFAGGYAGLLLAQDGTANLALLVTQARWRAAAGQWPTLLAQLQGEIPHLATRLAGAGSLRAAPLSIARIPYGFVHRPVAADPPGLFRLGDQAAVIHSFTGDGMALALHSAALAAAHILRGQSASAYHHRFAADISGQLARAAALHLGLGTPVLRAACFALAALFPPSIGLAVAATRIPAPARLRAPSARLFVAG